MLALPHKFQEPLLLLVFSAVINRHDVYSFDDFGATGCFLDQTRARHCWTIPCLRPKDPLSLTTLDGKPLDSGKVTNLTVLFRLTLEPAHSETIQFHLVTSSGAAPPLTHAALPRLGHRGIPVLGTNRDLSLHSISPQSYSVCRKGPTRYPCEK